MTWQHFNLHGEFDFSDERMVDSMGLAASPKNPVELLCRLFKCTGLHPGAKYDHGSLETACDVAFLASHVYFARLKDEKVRLA